MAPAWHGRATLLLSIFVHLPGDLPIAEAHTGTADIEKAVRAAVPRAYRVTVHPEPDEERVMSDE